MIIKDSHIISAVIGYWRSGATFKEIELLTNIPVSVLKKIIERVK